MKNNIIYFLIVSIGLTISSCYKYTIEPDYGTLSGEFVDKFSGTNLDVGNITLSPSLSVNGNMNLDTAGHFYNSKILPGAYTLYGSIKAAFTSDSALIDMKPGIKTEVKLEIEPWISVKQKVVDVVDTTITINYSIKGNRNMIPARHVIAWSTSPKPTVSVYPGGNRNFYTPNTGSENGTFNYKITGLKRNTTYFIVTGARTNDPVKNPSNDYNYARQIIIKTP
ncbi:hypothetical protein [Sphingobacterium sp.]|uniref:hypothetical protein n=1 Tax=Sphingobacterium sp. TaxID=341027 RepID=UPI0031DF73DD